MDVWCRVVVEGDGAPDLTIVDALARLALAAGRCGARVLVVDVAPPLADLLELTGLCEEPALCVEVRRQPELGEQTLGLEQGEEQAHPRNPAL